MVDFSIVLQSPEVRGIVQDGLLERSFHDALFPRLLFRGEAAPVPWPGGIGDTMIFSAPGLIPVDARPMQPGQDPDDSTYPVEQWFAQLQQYAGSIPTHMPTSMVAIANMFLRNTHQLGLQASQTVNRVVRNRLYAAALSGWTVATSTSSSTSLVVKRLNGFTRARNPTTSGASQVRFDPVSSVNPLPIKIFDNAAEVSNTVVGFTPDTPGDEYGPGTLTLGTACTSVAARAYVIADDRTSMVRVGGGNKTDDLTAGTDVPTLASIRTVVSGFRQDNVPEHPDGRFHAHLDPASEALIFADSEFQRLLTALPDHYTYRQFAVGEILGSVFFRNSENPLPETVVGGSTATYDARDPFPGELFHNGSSSTGARVHNMLFTGQGAVMEYYADLEGLLTEAGIAGMVADPRIVNNGIEIFSERIQLVIRQPLNKLQDMVSTSWKIMSDYPSRTDAATGGAGRYKRTRVIQHTE